MPRTNNTGSRSRNRNQPANKPAATPAGETAIKAPPEQQSEKHEGEAMFDDTPPAHTEIKAPPVDTGASTETVARGPETSDNPAPPSPSAADAQDGPVSTAQEPTAPQHPVGADTSEGPVQAAEQASSGGPVRVRLGRVEGVLHRVPLDLVQELVAESGSRIATLQSSPSIADLQNRMRVTEGRCAPIFFTMAEGDDEPRLFAGIETVAAAINLGLDAVSVVTIDAKDAGAAQQHLASKGNGRPASSQEEVLEVIE